MVTMCLKTLKELFNQWEQRYVYFISFVYKTNLFNLKKTRRAFSGNILFT